MRISLIDAENITEMILPNEISGVFFMDYYLQNEGIEKRINIEAEKKEWMIKSNGVINVYKDNMLMNKVPLEPYVPRKIELCGYKKYVTILPTPVMEQFELLKPTKNKITIGSSENNDIIFGTNQLYATIEFVNNQWIIQALGEVYLNHRRVSKHTLNLGDIIFIEGLRIIWMYHFLEVNNPLNLRKINTSSLKMYLLENEDNTKYMKPKEEEYQIDLYKQNEYFFHTPRLLEKIEPVEINIDDPPTSQLPEENPFWVTIGSGLTMGASALMSAFMVGNNIMNGRSWTSVIPSLVMCLSLIIGSIIMPRLVNNYQKKKMIRREELRQTKYKEYIAQKEKEIQLILNKHTQILRYENPSIEECTLLVKNNNRRLWGREIQDSDFLTVRLGMGDIPSQIKINTMEEKFTLEQDALKTMVTQVVKHSKLLKDIPITFSFLENKVSAIICNNQYKEAMINQILLQLVSFQSAAELKIVFFLNHSNADFDYAKYLPHTLNDNKSVRFFAKNSTEMQNISSYLEEIWKERKEIVGETEEKEDQNYYKKFNTYYLIITDNFLNVRSYSIIDNIIKSKNNFGFSLMVIENTLRKLPKECNTFIEILEKDGCIFQKELNQQTPFRLEPIVPLDMRDISYNLSKIPLSVADQISSLPTSLNFLEMYKVSKIEQLNISNRWKTNNPILSLKALIGVHTSGEDFVLDLHEKYHGPHGLIAGSTGSGKSEFIITYVLSMAINYHPDEVQFVLIDYKGGGLAGAFDNEQLNIRIPHIAGTITNLDVSDINRALVSIKSELKRRQQKFNDARNVTGESTIDIYKYQKYYREGVLTEPISHLFIISDEFAELKKEQPEFMTELITTSRIGRSLGVHLILATQKPSGVVNDQIWSNSKFKVCLKVQNRSDSMEMLKRPEAASIKETGRFYLQIGFDEYFDIGQSGWSGAKYIPSDKIIKKTDETISFIDNTGNIIKSINDIVPITTEDQNGDQLNNIVKELNKIAIDLNYQPKRLWLKKLPALIYLGNLIKKYNYQKEKNVINPIIGEYDDPSNQYQGLLTLNVSKYNTLMYGTSDSGIENTLLTLIYGMMIYHSPEELNLYIIDMGSEILRVLEGAPQIGDICFEEDNEKIFNLMLEIDKEIERRKELFVEYGGSYETYCKQSTTQLPVIVVIINGYEMFNESYPKIADMIPPLYRDGIKYGISFIITTGAANSIRMRVMEYFQNRICLQMANDTDYRTIIPSSPRGLKPAKEKGRGIINKDDNAYEFQTAYIYQEEQINQIIRDAIKNLKQTYSKGVKKVNILPTKVTKKEFEEKKYSLENIPIGYDYNNKTPYFYNFQQEKFNLISCQDITLHQDFIEEFCNILTSSNINYTQINAINQTENPQQLEYSITKMYQEISQEKNTNTKKVYLIIGLSNLYNRISENYQTYLDSIFASLKNFQNTYFIIMDNAKEYQNIKTKDWNFKNVTKTKGIWLGEGISTQLAINFPNIPFEEKKIYFESIGFVSCENSYRIIKALTKEES